MDEPIAIQFGIRHAKDATPIFGRKLCTGGLIEGGNRSHPVWVIAMLPRLACQLRTNLCQKSVCLSDGVADRYWDVVRMKNQRRFRILPMARGGPFTQGAGEFFRTLRTSL